MRPSDVIRQRGLATTLRDGAAALRSATPRGEERQQRGEMLQVIPSGPGHEWRMSYFTRPGLEPEIVVRLWGPDSRSGMAPLRGQGFTLRQRQLADFALGIAKALELAHANALEAFGDHNR